MVAKIFLTENGYLSNSGRSAYSVDLIDGTKPVVEGVATFGAVPGYDYNAPANSLNLGAELVDDTVDRLRRLIIPSNHVYLDKFLEKLPEGTPKNVAIMFFGEQFRGLQQKIGQDGWRRRERDSEEKLKKDIREAKKAGDETKAALRLAEMAIAEMGGLSDYDVDAEDNKTNAAAIDELVAMFNRLTEKKSIEEYQRVAMWCTAGVARTVVDRVVGGMVSLRWNVRDSIPFWPYFNDVIEKNNLRASLDRLYVFFGTLDPNAVVQALPFWTPERNPSLASVNPSPWFTPASRQKLILEILIGYFFN